MTHRPLAVALAALAPLGLSELAPRESGAPPPPAYAAANRLEIRLDRTVYAQRDSIAAAVTVLHTLAADALRLYVVAPESKDVEVVPLRPTTDRSVFETSLRLPVQPAGQAQAVRQDGRLTLRPNELFFAVFAPDAKAVRGALVADFGLFEDRGFKKAPHRVSAAVDPKDPRERLAGRKRFGTVLHRGSLPLQVAVDELIFYPRDPGDLQQFLAQTRGRVEKDDRPPGRPGAAPKAYLVKLTPGSMDPTHLSQMRALWGHKHPLYASSPELEKLLGLAIRYQLDGFVVMPNVRALSLDAPATQEAANGAPWDPRAAADVQAVGGRLDAMSADTTWNPRVHADPIFGVREAWAYLALFDRDTARVQVGFIDNGFAPNWDFRGYSAAGSTTLRQCDMETNRCADGSAVGPPTIGPGYFGSPWLWHGNAVVATAGGVLNNGWGAAGTGGQVVVPMLYSLGPSSYFEMGTAIRQATADGAHVLSISAGLLCAIPTDVGPLDICGPAGLTPVCAYVSTRLAAAATVLAFVPFVGPFLSHRALEASGAAFAVCEAANVALGPAGWRGPMQAAVREAVSQGVTIVAAGGNTWIPEVLRDIESAVAGLDPVGVGTGLRPTDEVAEHWQIIPCVLDGVICVGATLPLPPYVHGQWYGDSIDIYSPQGSTYFAPSDNNAVVGPDGQVPYSDSWAGGLDLTFPPRHQGFWGSSGATAFTSGVVAMMIAVNPTLNRSNPALSPVQRAGIPGRIRHLLVGSATPGTSIPGNPPGEPRDSLINAFAAVRAAARGVLPDPGERAALGFDEPKPPARCAGPLAEIERVRAQVARLQARIGGLNAQIRTIEGEIRAIYNVALWHRGREGDLTEAEDRAVETLEAWISGLRSQIATLTAQVATLKAEIARLTAALPKGCDQLVDDDGRDRATAIGARTDTTVRGTILVIPAEPPRGIPFIDEDWYVVTPESGVAYPGGRLRLAYYRGFGRIVVNGDTGLAIAPFRPNVPGAPAIELLEAREFRIPAQPQWADPRGWYARVSATAGTARAGVGGPGAGIRPGGPRDVPRLAIDPQSDNVYWLNFSPTP